MADYDVGVIGLTSPPSLAVLQTYRPAVSVRNYGIHDALASGVLRIYSAGLLAFTSEIYSAVIPPGETRDALAVGYWTPTEGTYLVIADVTCPLDQVESNNHLSPTQVIVSGELPPEPPTVPYHAAQHEEGNADELIVDGLHGRLADAQAALAHKASHQVGGSDLISVDGLTGILATPQPIADHHEEHEDGGGDELYVGGLHGVLADNQPAITHDNARHDPNYASVTELSNHLNDTTAVHAVATNLEQVSRKGDPDGYPELDPLGHVPPDQLAPPEASIPGFALVLSGPEAAAWGPAVPVVHSSGLHDDTVASRTGVDKLVPTEQLAPVTLQTPPDYVLRVDQTWGPGGAAAAHAATHENGGDDEISIAGLSGKAADAQDPTAHGNAAHSVAFEDSANKGAASGYAPLGADSLVPDEYLPAGQGGQPNALYVRYSHNVLQVVDEPGDTLVIATIATGTDIKPAYCMHVTITGYVNPHEENTYLQFLGKMVQELVDTWLCSTTCFFPASPDIGQFFKYEARLYFRLSSVTSFVDLSNNSEQSRGGDNGSAWDKDVWTSWQWYAHLGIPLLTAHIFSKQIIIEPYTA